MIVTPHSTHTPRPGSNGCLDCTDIERYARDFMTPLEQYEMDIRAANMRALIRQREQTRNVVMPDPETDAAIRRFYSDEGPIEKGD